jgi:hypothetical protein
MTSKTSPTPTCCAWRSCRSSAEASSKASLAAQRSLHPVPEQTDEIKEVRSRTFELVERRLPASLK